MNNITLLDCTLRDGGYVNDWMFGRKEMQEIVPLIGSSGVDYVELGFIKQEDYNREQAQFNHVDQITELLYPAKEKLSAIVEIGYGYPVTSFPERSEKTIDLVRVIMWKRSLKEGFEYCKELRKKGYEVGIQATRTEQYSDKEFTEFVQMFSELSPRGIYIVDTFGLLTKDELLKYANIADTNLGENIALGYHAHNNMQQAFSNAVAMAETDWKHELMIDASVFGMGRGAGNLCLELYMQYLNDKFNANYNIAPLLEVYDKYLDGFYKESPWGYSLPYYLSATNGLNPSYVNYFEEKKLSVMQIAKIFAEMKKRSIGILYNTQEADEIIDNVL
jgi:4-hydroxy 2-oxovalerate aldolase